MADSFHDQNHTPTILAMLNTNGLTLMNVAADPATHQLQTSDGTGGSDNGPANSRHDASHVPSWVATSNADGKTPVVLYADASGNLLVKST